MTSVEDSYYRDTMTVAPRAQAPLAGERRVDVCVIGGGVTGCSTALHLAERGYRVALLEAGPIGFGASGRSGGQILPGLGTDMRTVEKQLGFEDARAIWELSREAVSLTAELIERHAIPCDFTRGYLHAALRPRHVREMRAWQATMAQRYDYHALEWLEPERFRQRVVSEAYLGGLDDAEGAHLHPLNYTLGLARAAERQGAELYPFSRVTSLEPGAPARAVTEQGVVRADHVVVAANAYLGRLLPELESRIMPVANYIIATEPLSEAQAAQLLPCNDAVSDANFVLDYYRLSADRRLLYGGQVSYTGREPRGLRRRMELKMAQLFPVLRHVGIDYRWGGSVAITRNRAPHFGRLHDNILFVQGYSGHGMALAGLSGKLLAEAVAGQAERFDLFARLRHARFPGGAYLRTPLLVMATSLLKLRDQL
ncbi:gamma-glutamylputrescine oxidase [Kushneria sinocarnis]|uniref:Gamma-glutamylputrescine oxidase n=1 Tax=Kushneria sinocarnis TaxID=595502 RepID=A0A420WVI2_9GAMM|nr:FAD-binding oxidoreductase [Kushneria sinocarnis]RKR02563.1 gamma-glutamylputrescine oxidase [Kushneria sinocarnis]